MEDELFRWIKQRGYSTPYREQSYFSIIFQKILKTVNDQPQLKSFGHTLLSTKVREAMYCDTWMD